VFVLGKLFLPSLMFVSKAGAYSNIHDSYNLVNGFFKNNYKLLAGFSQTIIKIIPNFEKTGRKLV
jgi:hypothetical protein